MGLAGVRSIFCGSHQCQDVIYAVREAVIRICLFCFCQIFRIVIAIKIKVVKCHRSCCSCLYGHLQNLLHIIRKSSSGIVEGQFLIVVRHSVHENFHLFIFSEFVEATIVEEVCLQGFLADILHLRLLAHEPQNSSLQRQGLLVMRIVVEAATQFLPGIVKTFFHNTNLCRLEVAGICPCLVPCDLPEKIIGFFPDLIPQTFVL